MCPLFTCQFWQQNCILQPTVACVIGPEGSSTTPSGLPPRTERFSEQIFQTNLLIELILVIQYTQKNCYWHNQQGAGAPWRTHADTWDRTHDSVAMRRQCNCTTLYTKKLYKLQSIPFWSFVQHSFCLILSLLTHLYQINMRTTV